MKTFIHYASLLILFLVSSPDPSAAVEITFSEPLIIDTGSQAAIPRGNFIEAPGGVSVVRLFPGPDYDLVMAGDSRGYYLTRLDFDGNPVDSLPDFVSDFVTKYPTPLPDDIAGYNIKTVAWADLYWYFFLARDGRLYYSRATSDMAFVDVSPVELMPEPAQIIADGGYIWTVRQDSVTKKYYAGRIHLPDPTPLFAEVEIPDRFIDDGECTARDGLFFISHDYLLTRLQAAHLSPDGDFLEYDTLIYAPAGKGSDLRIMPWNADSALCVWLEHSDSTANRIGYLFVTAAGAPNPPQANTVLAGHTPGNSYPRLQDFALADSTVYMLIRLSSLSDSTIMVQLDPVNGDIISDDYVPPTTPIYNAASPNFRIHASKGLYTYVMGSDVVSGIFDLETLFEENPPGPVLFYTASQIHPTLIADTGGVLVYTGRAGDSSLDIHGYYMPYADDLHVSEDFDVITDDSLHMLPWLFAINGQKALFWENYQDPITYHSRLVLFDGLYPSPDRLADHTAALRDAGIAHRPTFSRADSLLYIDHYYSTGYITNWVPCLRSSIYAYDTKNDSLLSQTNGNSSVGDNALVPVDDSLVVTIPYRACTDPQAVICFEYECSYQGMTVCDGSLIRSFEFSGYPADCFSWVGVGGDSYIDLNVAEIGGESIISSENSFDLKKIDYSTQSLQTVVNIQSAGGIDIGGSLARYLIYPVETEDAIAVFLINGADYQPNRLLVFTKDWEYRGSTLLPTIGSIGDFSQFRYSPEANAIYFAYSTLLGKPFSSSRVVFQSVSLKDITDADDNGTSIHPAFALDQNSPNPFNASTRIRFSLPTQSDVTLVIYNILGQKITTLIDRSLPAGNHEVVWDGYDSRGKAVATGLYLYKINAGGKTITKKMMLLK